MPSTFSQHATEEEFAGMEAQIAAKHHALHEAHEQRCQGKAASQSPVHPVGPAGSIPLPKHTKVSNCFLREALETASVWGCHGGGRDGASLPCCKMAPETISLSERAQRWSQLRNQHKMQTASADDGQEVMLKLGSLFSLIGSEI